MSLPPSSHQQDAVLLTGDGKVDLFEIITIGGEKFYLKNNDTVTYNNITYEGAYVQFSGSKRTSNEETPRPSLTLVNPEGVLSRYVLNEMFDFGQVIRRQVLRTDLDNNTGNVYEEKYFISRATALTKRSVTFELRGYSDRFNAMIPARMYTLPDFPMVSLQ